MLDDFEKLWESYGRAWEGLSGPIQDLARAFCHAAYATGLVIGRKQAAATSVTIPASVTKDIDFKQVGPLGKVVVEGIPVDRLRRRSDFPWSVRPLFRPGDWVYYRDPGPTRGTFKPLRGHVFRVCIGPSDAWWYVVRFPECSKLCMIPESELQPAHSTEQPDDADSNDDQNHPELDEPGPGVGDGRSLAPDPEHKQESTEQEQCNTHPTGDRDRPSGVCGCGPVCIRHDTNSEK